MIIICTLLRINWVESLSNTLHPKKKESSSLHRTVMTEIFLNKLLVHGGLESNEIQKKNPGFDTHIF